MKATLWTPLGDALFFSWCTVEIKAVPLPPPLFTFERPQIILKTRLSHVFLYTYLSGFGFPRLLSCVPSSQFQREPDLDLSLIGLSIAFLPVFPLPFNSTSTPHPHSPLSQFPILASHPMVSLMIARMACQNPTFPLCYWFTVKAKRVTFPSSIQISETQRVPRDGVGRDSFS